MKRIIVIMICCVCMGLSGCDPMEASVPAQEEIELYYFHEASGASDEDESEFQAVFDEQLSDGEQGLYAYRLRSANVLQAEGREMLENVMEEKGIEAGNADFPLLLVNNKAYVGLESITENLREAFLTAGEDVFINRYVYSPKKPEADRPEARFPIDGKNATLVYFYRIVCEECQKTSPHIDSLPPTLTVGDRKVNSNVIRINSRSGDNGALVRRFFSAYGVPEEEQMVPIVFFRDKYLAGYEDIAAEALALLQNGEGQNFEFPPEE